MERFRPQGLDLKTTGPDQIIVIGDYNKTRRILQNLLLNALKYTRKGEVRIGLTKKEKTWELVMSDTGPGMQVSERTPVLQKINAPDADTDHHGSQSHLSYAGEGIGLTIVKRLCSMLRVSMEIDSTLGKGTAFTLNFPLVYKENDPPVPDEPK